MLIHANGGVNRINFTRLGEAEAVDSLREVVHANILRFAAILEELLRRKTHPVRNRTTIVDVPPAVTTHASY